MSRRKRTNYDIVENIVTGVFIVAAIASIAMTGVIVWAIVKLVQHFTS